MRHYFAAIRFRARYYFHYLFYIDFRHYAFFHYFRCYFIIIDAIDDYLITPLLPLLPPLTLPLMPFSLIPFSFIISIFIIIFAFDTLLLFHFADATHDAAFAILLFSLLITP
jgi:hypothetical protein